VLPKFMLVANPVTLRHIVEANHVVTAASQQLVAVQVPFGTVRGVFRSLASTIHRICGHSVRVLEVLPSKRLLLALYTSLNRRLDRCESLSH